MASVIAFFFLMEVNGRLQPCGRGLTGQQQELSISKAQRAKFVIEAIRITELNGIGSSF